MIFIYHFCYRELEKIELEGEDLYLPTAPNKLVRGIQVDSGIPLQSAAKVPIMITFNVVDRDGDKNDIKKRSKPFLFSLYFAAEFEHIKKVLRLHLVLDLSIYIFLLFSSFIFYFLKFIFFIF